MAKSLSWRAQKANDRIRPVRSWGMSQSARYDAVHDVEDECDVVVAKGDLIKECLRLRYQVYCVEKGFEPGRNGLETDPFDDKARHVLLIHRASGEPIGTVR